MENIAKVDLGDEPVSWGVVGAVIACVSIFGLTLGLSYPLLALILENQGVPKSLIGINAAMMPLGIIVSSPFVPKVARRMGAWQFAVVCLLVTIVLFGLLGAVPRIDHWYYIRFMLGMAINGMFVVSETWINQLATRSTRGRIMGLYVTVMSVGFCSGPFILPITGVDGWAPFLVGIASPMAAMVILLLFRHQLPAFRDKRYGSIARFLPLAPLLLMAVIATAYLDQAVLSFFPLYAIHYGLSQATGTFALGVLISGNIFLQIPANLTEFRSSLTEILLIPEAKNK